MSDKPFASNAKLTAVLLDYGNCPGDYMADCLFPMVNTCTQAFKYYKFDETQKFNAHNAAVGRKSQVREISELCADFVNDSTEDYGLEVAIPFADLAEQGCDCSEIPFDIKSTHARYLRDQITLEREVRAATLAFDASKYSASQKTDLTGSELNAPAGATDPLGLLLDLIDCRNKPYNWAYIPKKVMSVLKRHPEFLGNVDSRGVISKESIAGTLGLEGICTPNAYVNTAESGQTPVVEPIWGDSILLFYKNMNFSMTDCPQSTFAFRAQWGSFVAFEYVDNSIGLRGGIRMRVGVGEKLVVADYSQAHLITNTLV